MRKLSWIGLLIVLLIGTVSIGAASNNAVDAPAYTLMGKVTDASGSALEGVTVSAITDGGAHHVSVYSQADGTFRIEGLPVGKL